MSGASTTTKSRTPRSLPHLAGKLFDTPLLLTREKAEVIRTAFLDALERPAQDLAFFDFDDDAGDSSYELVGDVAVISAVGTLVQRKGGMDAMSGFVSYQALARQLDAALADPKVAGILFDLDSPGGECGGCFELTDKVFAARSVKPIYAVASPMACSAAYALASAAERLFAPAVSYVGSIGVITVHRDQSALDAELGVAYTTIYAGERKNDGDPHAPLGPEAHAAIKARIDEIYGVFVDTVARNRGIDAAAVRATEAGVLLGEKAVGAGLADAIGGRDEAIAALKGAVQERHMLKQLQDQVLALTTQNDALKVERDSLMAKAAEAAKLDAQRQKDADAAWLEQLQQAQADAQAPLLADEVSVVRAQLEAGNKPVAQSLAKAYTALACARAGKASASTSAVKLEPEGNKLKKTAAENEADMLRSRGWTVKLSDDKSSILEATAPGKQPPKPRKKR